MGVSGFELVDNVLINICSSRKGASQLVFIQQQLINTFNKFTSFYDVWPNSIATMHAGEE
jgi:hypothetical protein